MSGSSIIADGWFNNLRECHVMTGGNIPTAPVAAHWRRCKATISEDCWNGVV